MIEKVPSPPADESGGRDVVEVAVAGALNFVPLAGPWLSSGVQKIFAQQEQARLNGWLSEFAQTVNLLVESANGLSVEGLAQSSEFYEAAVRAARVAISTSRREKHQALKNALFNVGSSNTDADHGSVFFRYIDELTPTHIQLLVELAASGDNYVALETLVPVVRAPNQTEIYVSDLANRGLAEERPLFNKYEGGGMTVTKSSMAGGFRASTAGHSFLEYISGPFGDTRVTTEE